MKKHLTIIAAIIFCVTGSLIAQTKKEQQAVDILRKQLNAVEQEEKKTLKNQIDDINNLLRNGVIDNEEAKKLKLKAAMASTKKIEERQDALRESIFFLEERLDGTTKSDEIEIFLDVDTYSKEKAGIPIRLPENKRPLGDTPKTTSIPQAMNLPQNSMVKTPTTLDLIFALGLNNAIGEGITFQQIKDENDYNFHSSRFWEFGFALKTPLWRKNGFRLKYGISYQLNELEPRGNRIFGVLDGRTQLQDFWRPVSESRLLVHNLVLPVHLEFGPTKLKRAADGSSYYSTSNKFKIGIGGYIGYNLDAEQQVEYPILLRRWIFTKRDIIDVPNINQQIFGLSGYVGIGAFSIYGKYDLNSIFEDADLNNQQFVSVGVRIDL